MVLLTLLSWYARVDETERKGREMWIVFIYIIYQFHNNKLQALVESDTPYEISILRDGQLETAGRLEYGRKIDVCLFTSPLVLHHYPFTFSPLSRPPSPSNTPPPTDHNNILQAMTAHPKVDPVTNEMFFFYYNVMKTPYVTYGYLDPKGNVVR